MHSKLKSKQKWAKIMLKMRLDSFENPWSKFGITNDVILLNNVTVLRSGCTYHSFVTIVRWVKDGLFLTLIICIVYNVVRKVNGWLTKGWINQEQLWSKQTWMEKRQEIDENQLPWHGVLKCIRSRVNLAKRIIYLYSLIIAILGFSDSLLIFTSCILWSSFPQFSLSESSAIFHTHIAIKDMHMKYLTLSGYARSSYHTKFMKR